MKKYFITGLLVWLPAAITVWVLLWVVGLLDGVYHALLLTFAAVLPAPVIEPLAQLGRVRGLGFVLVGAAIFLTGVFVANIFGQWSVRQWHRLMSNIPIVRNIYSSVKQVSDTLFSSSGNAFREAVLVQYPREGSWTLAFVTGRPGGEVAHHLAAAEHLSLYVPTTPNPTSGFFLMVPQSDVIKLNMSVDEALKYIISMGVVAPPVEAAVLPVPIRQRTG